MAYEPLRMIWDYADGPRTGIADHDGRPHYFSCVFDDELGIYGDVFDITPIDDETYAWAQEHWAIWQRWETEAHAGRLSADSHPKYGHFDPRYNELEALLDQAIDRLAAQTVRRHGEIRRASIEGELFPGQWNRLEVEWTQPPVNASTR